MRSTRGVHLTEAARALVPRAEAVVRALDEAVRDARDAANGRLGVLRIAAAPTAAAGLVARAFALLRRERPGLGLSLREAYPDAARQLSAVREDDVWERGSCFGSPERVASMLKRYLERTGTNHIALEMRIGGLEHRKVMRSMELFARHVMPTVREAAAQRRLAATH